MIGSHYLLILTIHVTNAQFATHFDLQKVGEIIFNNEKYNVLKPTVHKITDHFKDFMLRRGNKNENEKIFIDDNGFRHFWNGLGIKYNNLRKTEISLFEINKNIQNENTEEANKETNDTAAKDVTNNVEETTKTAKKRPKRPKTSREEEEYEKALREAPAQTTIKTQGGAGAGKKVAITSFFCPFFGVIKMTSFID